MHRLAKYVMSGRSQAVSVAVILALLGFVFPPFALVSAAVVALIGLRKGIEQGLIVMGWGGLAIAVLAGLLLRAPLAGAVYALAQWLPVLVFAQVLRRTASWSIVMTVLALTGLVLVVAIHLLIPDVTQLWLNVLQQGLTSLLQRAGMTAAEVSDTVHRAAQYATGAFAMSLVLSVALSLILARSWQAALYNPGGFREEYTQWRLGMSLAGVATLLVLFALMFHNTVLIELVMVILTPFLMQALGLIHGLIRQSGLHIGWLVGLYVMLFLAPPQMGALLAAVGVIDSFADLRTRLRRGS